MKIAIVGCGFVADYYLATLPTYPDLELIGVTDRDPDRAARFAAFHSVPQYDLAATIFCIDARVELVLNLTNPQKPPRGHESLPRGRQARLQREAAGDGARPGQRAGRDWPKSEDSGLASAPCSLLGETAQTVWKALRERLVGTVRLVYAEMDDGMVFRMPYRKWTSASGTPWPAQDEFEVGCTFEHAGYYLTWFPAFFGPARTVTAFSACLAPDKQTDDAAGARSPRLLGGLHHVRIGSRGAADLQHHRPA